MSCRLILLIAVLTAMAAAPASAAELVEGTWNFEGGQVLVESTGTGTFKGTVTAPTKFSYCPHPKGEQIWSLSGTDKDFSGTHLWYRSDCTPNPGGKATWRIIDTDPSSFRLIFCTRHPDAGAPNPADTPDNHASGTFCYELTRAKPPGAAGSGDSGSTTAPSSQPSTLTPSQISLPSSRSCSTRSLRIRLPLAVRRNAKRISLYVDTKRVKRLTKRPLPKSTVLKKLPGRSFRLRFVAVTKKGKTVKRSKRYAGC
jgi:hypothetical protein